MILLHGAPTGDTYFAIILVLLLYIGLCAGILHFILYYLFRYRTKRDIWYWLILILLVFLLHLFTLYMRMIL